MLPQDQPLLLTKKPQDDDRFDTVIGVLLSFAMLAGVWHYAVKPNAKTGHPHTVGMGTTATVVPKACDTPATAPIEAPALQIKPPMVAPAPQVITVPTPQIATAKPAPVIVQVAPKPKPVIKVAKPVPKPKPAAPPPVEVALPPPVAIAPPPAPAIVAKPVVPEAPPPAAKPDIAPKIIIRESIEFGNGSARLPPAAMPRLLEIVQQLKNDTRALKIVGHTDNIGNAEDNHVLSLKRANAIMRFLVRSGVPAEHLTVEGAGADSPIADNATEEGRKRNRRIEITEQ